MRMHGWPSEFPQIEYSSLAPRRDQRPTLNRPPAGSPTRRDERLSLAGEASPPSAATENHDDWKTLWVVRHSGDGGVARADARTKRTSSSTHGSTPTENCPRKTALGRLRELPATPHLRRAGLLGVYNGQYTNLKYNYLKHIIPVRDLAPMKAWLLGTGTLITSDGKFWKARNETPASALATGSPTSTSRSRCSGPRAATLSCRRPSRTLAEGLQELYQGDAGAST